jgi:hypothetical protein
MFPADLTRVRSSLFDAGADECVRELLVEAGQVEDIVAHTVVKHGDLSFVKDFGFGTA